MTIRHAVNPTCLLTVPVSVPGVSFVAETPQVVTSLRDAIVEHLVAVGVMRDDITVRQHYTGTDYVLNFGIHCRTELLGDVSALLRRDAMPWYGKDYLQP